MFRRIWRSGWVYAWTDFSFFYLWYRQMMKLWIIRQPLFKILNISGPWWSRIRCDLNSFYLWDSFIRRSWRNLWTWSCVFTLFQIVLLLYWDFTNCSFWASRRSSDKCSFSILLHCLLIKSLVWSVLIHKYEFLLWDYLLSNFNVWYRR